MHTICTGKRKVHAQARRAGRPMSNLAFPPKDAGVLHHDGHVLILDVS